jgi:hypothetical protein
LRLPFRICRLQSDGDFHFAEALPTIDEAKTRIRELGEVRAGRVCQ